MERGEGLWQEAAAGVQSSLDAELRDEAHEVFVAEAARCRMADRVGRARVSLRCGVTLDGELAPDSDDAIEDHLVMTDEAGVSLLVPVAAIAAMTGSRPALRPEGQGRTRSLASWLRELWSTDEPIRLVDGSGRWVVGRLRYVGADHVEVVSGESARVVPLVSVEAWRRG